MDCKNNWLTLRASQPGKAHVEHQEDILKSTPKFEEQIISANIGENVELLLAYTDIYYSLRLIWSFTEWIKISSDQSKIIDYYWS